MPRKQGRDTSRNVRIPDDLWDQAKACAEVRGDPSLSHIMREALTQYVRATERLQAKGQLPPYPPQRSEPHDDDEA